LAPASAALAPGTFPLLARPTGATRFFPRLPSHSTLLAHSWCQSPASRNNPAGITLSVHTRLSVLLNVVSAADVLATLDRRPMATTRRAANVHPHLRPPQALGLPPGYRPFLDAGPTAVLTPSASSSPVSPSSSFQHPSQNPVQRLDTNFYHPLFGPSIGSPNHHSVDTVPRSALTSQFSSFAYNLSNILLPTSHC
jgi:hypothetical protein